jgi:iron complex outermembrane receptor protein
MRITLSMAALAAAGLSAVTSMAARAQTAAADESLQEVVVTGSRIITNGNDAPTPVTVITPQDVLTTKPTTLYENLTELPAFSGSRGAANSPPQGGSQGQTAISALNLRNMGAQRNLVLLDGHRVPPVTADALVDVGSLPQLLIQRVDVVTGGASAVYGSDAITGVTNFVTDRNFNGVKGNIQRGISAQNDAASYDVGIAAGTAVFDGRGHIEGSYQRRNDNGLLSDQRDWYAPRWTVQGDGITIPWHLQGYVTNATASYGGAIACPNGTLASSGCLLNGKARPLVGLTFNQNGFLSPFNFGTGTGSASGSTNGLTLSSIQGGGDGVYFTHVSLRSAQHSDQGFLRFDYDLTDNLHAYFVGSLTANTAAGSRGTQRSFPPGWKLGACNAFLGSQYQTALGCTAANSGTANEPTFTFEKAFNPADNFGVGQSTVLGTHYHYFLGGLEGKFGDGYHWDFTLTDSQSRMDANNQTANSNNIYAALDAVVDPSSGQVVCRVTLTNASQYPGCVPVNLFGPTSVTQANINYMFPNVETLTTTKLKGAAASVTGSPVNDWAGPIGVALSGELRRLTMDLWSSNRPDSFLTCAGLRFGNCVPGVTVNSGGLIPISGVSQTVGEGALEFNVPLIRDLSLVKSLTFNGAARYTKYKNDPNDPTIVSRNFIADTWKAGLVWNVTDSLTLRWSRSRDIRAPNLLDLYNPVSTATPQFAFDYLLPGAPQISANPKSGGNPYLVPEVAHTTTLGLVWRPNSQFSLALDGYDITLTNALYSLSGANQPIQLACYASGGSSPLCQLQERPFGCCSNTTTANQMTAYYTRNVNIAEQRTAGIDLESSFNTRLFDRAASLRALVTYQPHILQYIPFSTRQDVAGVAYPQIGGLPAPVWKATLFARYKVSSQWEIDVSERWRSHLKWTSDPTQSEVGGVPSVAYTDLTVSYDIPTSLKETSVFLNVQNLFDKDPPPAGTLDATFPGSYPGVLAFGDDVLGRYFVFGVRARL